MSPGHDEPVTDSPTGWVAKHIRRYVESDGKNGHEWRGVDTLLLTTRGRSTGKLRRTALIYGRDRIATSWWHRTAARSHIRTGIRTSWRTRTSPCRSVTTRSMRSRGQRRRAEKPGLWEQMVAIWPDYAKYQKKTEREIPVVILERMP